MKKLIAKIPGLRFIAEAVYFLITSRFKSFSGSEAYWKERYKVGGNSGAGSYGRLAEFKADIINDFVREKKVDFVIEYGCGDGNQLKLANYPSYIGFDVSEEVISQCESLFSKDTTKTFRLVEAYNAEMADLTLSLDVIYHLVEDKVFNSYMQLLFDSSRRFVMIYSSNTDTQFRFQLLHVKNRNFTNWIEKNRPGWKLIQQIPNKYPYRGNGQTGSISDFYIYEKA